MSVYNDGFYQSQFERSYLSARRVVSILHEVYSPNSVVDFGCGRGAWLEAFYQSGSVTLLGYDGDWNANELASQNTFQFIPRNLEERILPPIEKFDIAISVEVAEHLPESAADIFVENLIGHSDVILFGASVEHQGGTHHVNEQRQSYWGEKFRSRNFLIFDFFRPRIWGLGEVDFWYRQNMFLYVREGSSLHQRLDQLGVEQVSNLTWMDVVHPDLLEIWVKRANSPLRHSLRRVYHRTRDRS
ncbi:hypothetical protein CHX26_09030 [Porphyrobacter sp. HT-58-2]|uniref:class I SAM-dependent methyltransferase n=1 Tax=Porphyrobacter sp. HT-58-2 TaxID=2023229 RepID=UPI000CDBDFEB|nr:class I SAM-dependent methyltransferase [Porphyrobacter sp. HT-58-2]AUX69619.1 hypothetical protein CHX26_09030 [Porphyrobacter sp. HT-58-2]